MRGSQCRGQETCEDEIERDHRVKVVVWGIRVSCFCQLVYERDVNGCRAGVCRNECRVIRSVSKECVTGISIRELLKNTGSATVLQEKHNAVDKGDGGVISFLGYTIE